MKNTLKTQLVKVLQFLADSIIERGKVADKDETQKLYEFGMTLDTYTRFYLDVELN